MKPKHFALLAAVVLAIGLAGLPKPWKAAATESITETASAQAPRLRMRAESPVTRPAHHLREPVKHARAGFASEPTYCKNPGRSRIDDPAAAARIADSLEPGKLRDRRLLQAIQTWAANDLDDAKRWAGRRPDPAEREWLLQAIEDAVNGGDALAGADKSTIDLLADSVNQLAWDDTKGTLVESLAGKWASEDLAAARDWVLGQPGGEIRDALIQRIAIEQVASNPTEAARLVAEEIPPGPQQDEAVLSVVNRWALLTPVAAAAWVKAFPEGPLKTRAQQELQGLASYQAAMATHTSAR